MKRRKPLKRTPIPARTSWMPRQSEKKRKERSDTDGPRRAYRELFKTCQCCEVRKSKHTHEMASGGARAQSVYHRETFLAVCVKCHKAIHETMAWPLSRQLCAKKRGDHAYYDRRLVLRLKGWDEEAIPETEVEACE